MFLNKHSKIVFYTKPMNLHKGFDRLMVIVQTEIGLQLDHETYFLFCNRNRDIIKILYLDGDNLAIWCKRIGFTLSFKYDADVVIFTQDEFLSFLKSKVTMRGFKRYIPAQ